MRVFMGNVTWGEIVRILREDGTRSVDIGNIFVCSTLNWTAYAGFSSSSQMCGTCHHFS